jgi:hypothetical protein
MGGVPQAQGPYNGLIKAQLGTRGVRLNAVGVYGAGGAIRYQEVLL